MRVLYIHSDYLEYNVTKKTKFADPIPEDKKTGKMEEALVVFVTSEKIDEGIECDAAKKAVADIADVAEKVKTKNVVLYPYAHLSSDLSTPETGKLLMKELENGLKDAGFSVLASPFGWYKSFKLSCKGHPLSELSRNITVGKDETTKKSQKEKEKEIISESLKKEATVKSKFFILTPDGGLVDIENFDFSRYPNLKKFVEYETKKERAYAIEPPHIALMREHELIDFERGSDPGNFRWYPKGKVMKKLLEKYITDVYTKYGGMEVETPIMYDFAHPSLKKYLNKFPARQYVVKSDDKEYFLRFAACFGQFLMGHDMNISYRNLPLRMFELTRYSFRREKSGELCGIKRLRAFTMPDMHTACKDMPQAKDEFIAQFEMCLDWMSTLDMEFETAFRIQADFYVENKSWYEKMAKRLNRPMLVEMFDVRYAYFITKFEFNVIDTQNKAAALSTVQIDVENSETYEMYYNDSDGKRKHPILLHTSVSGSIERNIYAILEREAEKIKRGEKPEFPFWLSPIQIRLIPVSNEFLPDCEKICSEIVARADIDDREEKVGKKIRDAEKEWVNMIIVYGEKERNSKKLPIRFRSGDLKEMAIDELKKEISERRKGYPFEKLPLPRLMSKRPVFRG
jgi:threonyl-tRNA synthetase